MDPNAFQGQRYSLARESSFGLEASFQLDVSRTPLYRASWYPNHLTGPLSMQGSSDSTIYDLWVQPSCPEVRVGRKIDRSQLQSPLTCEQDPDILTLLPLVQILVSASQGGSVGSVGLQMVVSWFGHLKRELNWIEFIMCFCKSGMLCLNAGM